MEEGTKVRLERGTGMTVDYHRAVYLRADVELQALRDRSKPASPQVLRQEPTTVICVPRQRRFGR
jgi:hypothetical protein